MDHCSEEGLEFDRDAIEAAALFHDAKYHEDLPEEHETKEAYSAFIARAHLAELGFEEKFIQKVEDAILGTDPMISPDDVENLSIEAKILRSSDVAGMAGDFGDFMVDNVKLKAEWERLNNKREEITWGEWKKKSEFIIGKYLEGNIRLTKHYYDEETGESAFHKSVRYNLNRFLESNEQDLNSYR